METPPRPGERDRSFGLSDTVASVSFEAKANYLQPRLRGAPTKGGRLLQTVFFSSGAQPLIQGGRQRRRNCACTTIRDGGVGGVGGSDDFLVPDHQHMLYC